MANEVLYSGLGDEALAEIAAKEFELLAADRSVLGNHPALIYCGDIAGQRSATVQLSFLGLAGYDLLAAAGENASVSNTAFTDASASVAVARRALKYNVSELARITGADLGAFTDPSVIAQSAIAVRDCTIRDMVANLVDGFASSVGTSGVDLTLDDILSALATLEANKVPGPYICMLHPQQWADLRADMRGELVLSPVAQEMLAKAPELGFKGNWFGVDFFVSASVPTANGGADRAGAVWGRGCVAWADASFPQAVAQYGVPKLNLGKVQIAFDESASSAMTDVVYSAYLGASIAQDLGVSIITDA